MDDITHELTTLVGQIGDAQDDGNKSLEAELKAELYKRALEWIRDNEPPGCDCQWVAGLALSRDV